MDVFSKYFIYSVIVCFWLSIFVACDSTVEPNKSTTEKLNTPFIHDPGDTLFSSERYTISWSSIYSATTYSLEESIDSLFVDVVTLVTPDTQLSFEHNVNKNTTFYYRVRAMNNDAVSSWSEKINITVLYPEVNAFADGFETGDFRNWIMNTARPSSAVIVSDPVRDGNHAAKIKLAPGDISNGGNRAEIINYNFLPYKSEVYYAWSFMIPEDYQENNLWQMLCQFHNVPNWIIGETWDNCTDRVPPVAMLYMNDRISLWVNSIRYNEEMIADFPATKGVWINIVWHIKWSLDDDAFVEILKDGEYITPFNGTDNKFYRENLYNKVGNYLKIGLYRDNNITSTNTIYIDEFRIGPSLEAVSDTY